MLPIAAVICVASIKLVGIAFATPNAPEIGVPAQSGLTFALFDEPDESWLDWAPRSHDAPEPAIVSA